MLALSRMNSCHLMKNTHKWHVNLYQVRVTSIERISHAPISFCTSSIPKEGLDFLCPDLIVFPPEVYAYCALETIEDSLSFPVYERSLTDI